MKLRVNVILVLYLFATLGIVVFFLGVVVSEQAFLPATIGSAIDFREAPVLAWFYAFWPLWCILCLLVAQITTMPFLISSESSLPLSTRSLIAPSLASGLMVGCLVIAVGHASWLYFRVENPTAMAWSTLTVGLLTWCGWAYAWLRKSPHREAVNVIPQQCRLLIKMGVAWLMIAGVFYVASDKNGTGCYGASCLVVSAACAIAFAFQPKVFWYFMRYWKKRAEPDAMVS